MMRNYLWLLLLFLTACGGGGGGGAGGGSAPPPVPIGSVGGIGFDGLLINSDIRIYDFSTGKKGALLGQAVSDNTGLYKINLQVESRPILIEATGGYYMEEAGSGFQVKLTASHVLQAVSLYSTGAAPIVATTTFTHLAAGLAAYQISTGVPVAKAINDANSRVSAMLGFDILTTLPKQITDPANASSALSAELRYGFMAGAISMWTYKNTPAASVAHKVPFTSMDFAQILYDDVAYDGVLDGTGKGGLKLSYGTTAITTDIYRLALGVSLLQMAGDVNNKTTLNGAAVLPFVQSYIASTDSIFNTVAPTSITAPVVNISTPVANAIWVGAAVPVAATVSTVNTLKSVELLVDGAVAATATNLAAPTFTVISTAYPDGTHTVGIRATDIGGLVTTASVPVLVLNSTPSLTIVSPAASAVLKGLSTISASTTSSVGLSKVELLVDGVFVTNALSPASPSFSLDTSKYADGVHTLGLRATDIGGQVILSTRAVTFANVAPFVSISNPASAAIIRGSMNVGVTATSASGLSKLELLVDGVVATTINNPAAPPVVPQLPLITTNYADGTHNLGVRATDVGGLVTTVTIPVSFGNVAPVVTMSSPTISAIIRGTININATTQSLLGVKTNELLVDGLLVATSANLASPSFPLNTALYLDGAHSVAIRSTDLGGLVTTASVPVTINNVAPVVKVTAPVANAVVSTTMTVTGTVSSGAGLATVELLLDGNVAGVTSLSPTAPSFNLNINGVADGAHTVGIRATDIGGLVTTATVVVVVSNVPPTMTLISPAANAVIAGTLNVSGTASSGSGITKVDLLLDGAVVGTAAATNAPSISFNSVLYADGAHTLGLRATDVGGRTTTSNVAVVINNVAPIVTLTSPAANASLSNTVTVSATTQSLAGVAMSELLLDGVAISTTIAAPSFVWNTIQYPDGPHTVGIRSTDVGGHKTTTTVPVMIANILPTVALTSHAANAWLRRVVTIAGTASYPQVGGLSKVELLVDGVVAGTAASVTAPSIALNTALYADGLHAIALRATDIDGATATSSVSVGFDNTAPTSTFVVVSPGIGGTPYIVQGVASDASSGASTIAWNGGAPSVVGVGGAWSAAPLNTTPSLTGIQYVVTDKAGNCSNYGGTFAFISNCL